MNKYPLVKMLKAKYKMKILKVVREKLIIIYKGGGAKRLTDNFLAETVEARRH